MKLIAAILIVMLPVDILSITKDSSTYNWEYSPENVAGFTGYLIKKKEFYRASIELQRLMNYYPDFLDPVKYQISNYYILFNGGQYPDLIQDSQVKDNINKIPSLMVFRLDSHLKMANLKEADYIINSWKFGFNKEMDSYIYKRMLFINISSGRFGNIQAFNKKIKSDSFSMYHDLIENSKKKYTGLKSPSAAALMGIIPGMGYAYSGETNTGIVALMIVTINAFLSYYAFSTGNDALGIFVGAIGTFFYTGNILGGYMAAKRYNRRFLESQRNYLEDELEFEKDRDNIFNRYGISGFGTEK